MKRSLVILALSAAIACAAAVAVPFLNWETTVDQAGIAYEAAANSQIDDPPAGKQFTSEAVDKITKHRAAATLSAQARAIVVVNAYEDIPPPPPPGLPNYFGRQTFVLDGKCKLIADPAKPLDSQWSGADVDPAGRIWAITDKIQNGGFIHRIAFAGSGGTFAATVDKVVGITLNGNAIDPEAISFGKSLGPTSVELCISSEQDNDKALWIFPFDYVTPPASLDTMTATKVPMAAGENMHYRDDLDQWHFIGPQDYPTVNRQLVVGTGKYDPNPDMSGSLRYPCRENAFNGAVCRNPFFLKSHPGDLVHMIREVDSSGDYNDADDRIISEFPLWAFLEPTKVLTDPMFPPPEGRPGRDELKAEGMVILDGEFYVFSEGTNGKNNCFHFVVQQP